MLHDKNYSSYSNEDIFSSNGALFNKRKDFYETSIKKKKEKLISYMNESDSLINALKHFSVKHELNDNKKLKDCKFVVSFDDLITLVKYSLESQKQLNYFFLDELENIKNFTCSFINNIYNYFYSLEKFEKITPIPKTRNKTNFSLNKENTNINTIKTSYTTKTNNNNLRLSDKSFNCFAEKEISKINQNNKKPKLNFNNQTNYKNNKRKINTNTAFINLNMNSNDKNNYIKSYFMRKNYKNLSTISLLVESNIKKNNTIKSKKIHINKRPEKKFNKVICQTFFLNKSESSTEINKRNNKKNNIVKTINYPLSIVTALDYVKNSSFVLNNKSKDENNLDKKSNLNLNKSMNDITNKDNKLIYYSQNNIVQGVRKKIINRVVPRPSNLANKLLERGIKYITEFNGMEEEEQKKIHYY